MPHIRVVDREVAGELAAAVWPAYDAVFGDHDSFDEWRTEMFDRHRMRDGFRLALCLATDRATHDQMCIRVGDEADCGRSAGRGSERGSATRTHIRSGGQLVLGFGWSYVGERGQFWSDWVVRTLPPDLAAEWVGGHREVVSIGVLAECRGVGVGGRILDGLLSGEDHDLGVSGQQPERPPAAGGVQPDRWGGRVGPGPEQRLPGWRPPA